MTMAYQSRYILSIHPILLLFFGCTVLGLQCRSSKGPQRGHCWCVDELGAPLPFQGGADTLPCDGEWDLDSEPAGGRTVIGGIHDMHFLQEKKQHIEFCVKAHTHCHSPATSWAAALLTAPTSIFDTARVCSRLSGWTLLNPKPLQRHCHKEATHSFSVCINTTDSRSHDKPEVETLQPIGWKVKQQRTWKASSCHWVEKMLGIFLYWVMIFCMYKSVCYCLKYVLQHIYFL